MAPMLVRNRMSSKVITVEPQQPVADARALLRRHRIHHLPVLGKQRLVGIVTDRDLRSAPATASTVATVMTPKPVCIAPDAFVDEAAHLLRHHRIGGLPVVENGKLVGMLTASDVLDAFIDVSGVGQPTYQLVLSNAKGRHAEEEVRAIMQKGRAELKWLQRDTRDASRLHLRVRVRDIDSTAYGLEAAGFAVDAVIASSPHTARRS